MFQEPTFLAGAAVGLIKNQLILAPLGAPAIIIYVPWHTVFIPHFTTYGNESRKTDLHYARLKKHKTFKYSNVGFGILGNILARHHNTNFKGLLQQEFCASLGLKETPTQPKNYQKEATPLPMTFLVCAPYERNLPNGAWKESDISRCPLKT